MPDFRKLMKGVDQADMRLLLMHSETIEVANRMVRDLEDVRDGINRILHQTAARVERLKRGG